MTMPTDDATRGAELASAWQRAQAGDVAAYRAALDMLARRLRAYFSRRMHGAPADVEDLVQETLLALHLQRGTHGPSVPLLAWVHAIARHKWVDALRRYGRREALHEPLDELLESAHPAVEPAPESHHDLQALLGQLSQAQRTAIVHTKLEGLSVAEASARCGQSASALKVNVHRGLKRLAALLRGEGGWM